MKKGILPLQYGNDGEIVPYIKKLGISSAFNDVVWNSKDINCYTFVLDCPEMGWALPGQLMVEQHNPLAENDFKFEPFKDFLKKVNTL